MATSPDSTDLLLGPRSSTLSDASFGSKRTTVVASPESPVYQRPACQRVDSLAEHIDSSFNSPQPRDNVNVHTASKGHGLGISNWDGQSRITVTRVPVASKSDANRLPLPLSPSEAKLAGKLYRSLGSHPEEDERDGQYVAYDHSTPSLHQNFGATSELEDLNSSPPPTTEKESSYKTRKPYEVSRGTWLGVTIMVLAVYSTLFSGLWLIIALKKLRYGHLIAKMGNITASTLCAAIAKSIELSFVTVFVAFVGQLLSTRALNEKGKGVTIAEMAMKTWVMQPGTMLTHFESVKYAAATFLGVFTLLAALMAMVYTTASDALVAPHLKFSKTEDRQIWGRVSATFANPNFIGLQCNTPISLDEDPASATTCLQLQHNGQAFHNYMQFLDTWTENIASGNNSDDLAHRPEPVGMLYDNTTVKGSWINIQNMTLLSAEHHRMINNVTMAMPHAGVLAAARDSRNGIVQPQNLDGFGEYYIQASVPSPTVNVLCANASAEELAPMVFSTWPEPNNNGTNTPNTTTWPNDYNLTFPNTEKTTRLDDIFGFDDVQVHPIFPKFPLKYNTIFNHTSIYGATAVYLLATSPKETYTLCSLRVALSPSCSTEYHSSMIGGSLTSHCEDPNDRLAYSRSEPEAHGGIWNADWINIASEWALGLSLNAGITDGQSTNARLLTQLIPTSPELDPSLPSISEALAILAGNTLLLSTIDTPFIHYWNYSQTVPILKDPQYQRFKATFRTQDYTSGGAQSWQQIFHLVLAPVFIINVCCLVYFATHGPFVTDFIEPQNLFVLSLNSPPSAAIEGASSTGPEAKDLQVPWCIEVDKEDQHLVLESRKGWSSGKGRPIHKRPRNWSGKRDYEMEGGLLGKMYTRVSKKVTGS